MTPDSDTRGSPRSVGRRAGRDLGAAIGVGVGLGALALAALLTIKQTFLLLVAAAVVLGLRELHTATARRQVAPPIAVVLGGGVLLVPAAYYFGPSGLAVGAVGAVLAVLLARLFAGAGDYLNDVAMSVFQLMYVPALAAFVLLMLRPEDGPVRVLTFIIVVVASDVGGYAVGVLAGRHPLAPSISPHKTREGAAGSLVLAGVGGWLAVTSLLGGEGWQGLVVGLAVSIAAMVGDLVESMIKRDLGVKDMSGLLPGHGGVMDRLDSLLFAAPIAYALLAWMVSSPLAL